MEPVIGRRPAVLAIGVLLVLGGCGGDGDGGPSRASYIAAADRICAPARRDAAPLLERLSNAGSRTAAQARRLAASTRGLHEIGIDALTRLRMLERPEGDDATINAFLHPLSELLDAVREASVALGEGNATGALAALQQVQALDDKVSAAATAYGFKECDELVAPPR